MAFERNFIDSGERLRAAKASNAPDQFCNEKCHRGPHHGRTEREAKNDSPELRYTEEGEVASIKFKTDETKYSSYFEINKARELVERTISQTVTADQSANLASQFVARMASGPALIELETVRMFEILTVVVLLCAAMR